MNISITCRHQTRVSRYKKKMLQEIRSTKHLDSSISQINLVFSIVSKNPGKFCPVECHLSVKNQAGWLELFNQANSEIRAFNLCFEEFLYHLLKVREKELTARNIKQFFPYLSLVPDFADQCISDAEKRL